jgi:hypothetical protein
MARIAISNYRVLFDRQSEGFRASAASVDYHRGRLSLLFMYASDAEIGVPQHRAESLDMGQTWSAPGPYGPPLPDPVNQFQTVNFAGRTHRGTAVLAGMCRNKQPLEEHEPLWRPCEALIGRLEEGASQTTWMRFPRGTFSEEQFVAPGLITAAGRIVLTIWGSAAKGENWRCGVLLSDDDGQTWRYRMVGYEPDLAIRYNPAIPAGFNEQSLFEFPDGKLVSNMRGREHLGHSGNSQDVPLFFRSISADGGETWSKPEMTNLPGTGAAVAGIVLADGSMLLPLRVPPRDQARWVRAEQPDLFGLHLARSFDAGKTWQTEAILQHDPGGRPFDGYYNVMNGQFISLGDQRWMYVFGHFEHERDRHRVLSLEINAAGH